MSYIYNLADTWNAGATTFTAIKMNVTDTASAAGSLLIDLQTGGTSRFNVTKTGVVTVGSTLELGNASDTTLARASAGVVTIEGNTVYTSGNLPGTAISWTAQQTFNAPGSDLGHILITGSQNNLGLVIDNNQAGATDRWAIWSSATGSGFGAGLLVIGRYVSAPAITINSSDVVAFQQTPTAAGNTVYHAGNLPNTSITWTANQTLSDVNLILGTTTGTKIGTATNQKLGFYNATPVVQPTAVADATDAATAITQLNALLSRMRNLGLIAT